MIRYDDGTCDAPLKYQEDGGERFGCHPKLALAKLATVSRYGTPTDRDGSSRSWPRVSPLRVHERQDRKLRREGLPPDSTVSTRRKLARGKVDPRLTLVGLVHSDSTRCNSSRSRLDCHLAGWHSKLQLSRVRAFERRPCGSPSPNARCRLDYAVERRLKWPLAACGTVTRKRRERQKVTPSGEEKKCKNERPTEGIEPSTSPNQI